MQRLADRSKNTPAAQAVAAVPSDTLDPGRSAHRWVYRQCFVPLITFGQDTGAATGASSAGLALNPFSKQWLDGKGRWPGVDWKKTAMRAITGLLDDPYNARQMPLVVDFSKGHAVLFGASSYGKTRLIRTLITSLACSHSPDEFQAHMLDLGGRDLEVLGGAAEVGTVILPDEAGYEERVQQLLRELNDRVDLRKRKLADAGVSTLFEYNGKGELLDRTGHPLGRRQFCRVHRNFRQPQRRR